MSWAGAETLALLALAASLVFAMLSPRGLPEATVAAPAAVVLILFGVVSWSQALDQLRSLGPTVGFLAAILVLAHLAQVEGVFAWLGAWLARAATARPQRLLLLVFGAASVVTAVLSLDATVVLLTPVVMLAAVRAGAVPRPHLYACAHLANSASQLMPVSNLTNLLAFAACGVSFGGFVALMALPWIVAIAVEYIVLRTFFRRDLRRHAQLPTTTDSRPDGELDGELDDAGTPVFAFVVLAATLAGFAVSGFIDLPPVWVATAGAAVLAVRGLVRGSVRPPAVLAAASPLFCVFVLALGVIVAGVSTHGLGSLLTGVLPHTSNLPELLLTAAIAAVLANVVNNIPATLLLLAALQQVDPAGPAHLGLVLAVLIGVNIGPNLTYIGSLATLLWRRVLSGRGAAPTLGTFTRLGAVTVPLGLAATVAVLWSELRLGI